MRNLLIIWLLLIVIFFSGSSARGQQTRAAPVSLAAQARPLNAVQAAGNAQNVQYLGHVGGVTDTLFVAGNRAYIGEGTRLTILDITNPAQPTLLGKTQPLPGIVRGVMVNGNTAYVANGEAGLHMIDVTNPAAPSELGFYATPDDAWDVYVADGLAYIAGGDSGLLVVNVTNPAQPVAVGAFDTPNTAWSLFVVDKTVYIADAAGSGLRIIDVTNPAVPAQLGFYVTPGIAHDVFVSGNFAYVADYTKGLRVINIANPANPTESGFYDTVGYAKGVFVKDNTAYIADNHGGLQLVNVTNPALPALITIPLDTPGSADDLVVVGDKVYLADHGAGLQVINVANLSIPTPFGAYRTVGDATGIFVEGDTAYLTDGLGLWTVDISDPTQPTTTGFKASSGSSRDVSVSGIYGAVANGDTGVQFMGITSPPTLTVYSTYNSPGFAYSVLVKDGGINVDDKAYVADGVAGLRILNVPTPVNPAEVGFLDTTGTTRDVYVAGTKAYLADDNGGLRVVNVSNPAAPALLGSYATSGAASRVFASGNTAYIGSSAGLHVLDVTNPANIAELGFFDTTDSVQGLHVVGSTAYVATFSAGVRIVNVTTPANLTEVGFYDTPGIGEDLFVVNGLIYLADGNNGLVILRYPPCYRLTLRHQGQGANPTVNLPNSNGCPVGEYNFLTSLSLTASPAPAWRVVSWAGANNENSTSTNNVLTMPAADHTVTVNYAPICYGLTLTHSGTGSDPAPSPANSDGCAAGQYVAGQTITLNALPGTGNTVGSWSGTTTDNSTALANTVTMPAAAHTAGVAYTLACYSLTLTHSGQGSDPTAAPANSEGCPTARYHFNEAITLSATPDAGWQIAGWSGASNNAATTPTNSLTMPPNDHTVSVNYSEIPTAGPGDTFEVDNSCTRHRPIAADGSETQAHTFHAPADEDWVRFTVAAGSTYRIEVQVPADSSADVNLEVYAQCEAPAFDDWQESFSPGARLDVTAPASGQVYVRLTNQDAAVAGANVAYQLSVRALSGDTSNRALILLAGRLRGNDSLQKNIHNVTNAVYTLFQRNGYTDDNIQYLATDTNLAGFDAAATRENLRSAITQWAKTKVGNGGVLTLYLMDHGGVETFYIDELSNQRLSPSDLDGWLTELEAALPNIKINVIIEACQSGSFVTPPQSISKANRVVIASTNDVNDAKASKDGAYFSDHLLTWLHQGYNLLVAFDEAREVASTVFVLQQAMIDANGNGIPNELTDGAIAASRSFAYAGTFSSDDWPPHIFAVQMPAAINNFSGVIQADVRDNQQVRQVWAVVYPPDYTPPTTGQELQPEVLPTFLLTPVDNGSLYAGEFTGFTQTGLYRIVVQAEDADGLVARPVVIEVSAGSKLFLPLVNR